MNFKRITIHHLLLALVYATPLISSPRQVYNRENCQNVKLINSLYYLLEDQFNITGVPADMSVYWKTGDVFFTMINNQMKMHLEVLHPNNEIQILNMPGLGQSSTVDNANDIIYLATDNGVYKYKDGRPELYTASGEDVMYVAAASDGTIYITTWPQNLVHKITNQGKKKETFSAIPNGHALTIDTNDNLYFVAAKTSYILKKGQTIPIKISGLPNDKTTGVFVSIKRDTYAMDESSNIYLIDTENASAKLLGSFNVSDVNTFAMDANENVLIGIKGSILWFKVHKKNPCENV